MLARALTKCLNVLVILFLMCPNRCHLSVPIGNQQEYYHAVRRSSNMKFSENIPPALRHNVEKIVDKDNFEEAEPGLSLTDEQTRKFKLWDKGMVSYYIDVLSFADKVLRDRIRWFLNLVNSLTSLNFVELPRPPKDDQMRWVFFVNRRGRLSCADHSTMNFTNKGVQPVALGYDCMNTGGELAEAVLAIAGVPPQHNSPDRDDYIEILEDNIMPDKRYLFQKLNDDDWLYGDISYDFASAGHFHPHKYSVNGRATIIAKKPTEGVEKDKPGGLSYDDLRKINKLYNLIKKKKNKNKELQCSKLFTSVKKVNKNKSKSKNKKPRLNTITFLGHKKEFAKSENNEKESFEGSGNSTGIDDTGSTDNANIENSLESEESIETDFSVAEIKQGQNFGRNQKPETLPNETNLPRHYYKDPLTYLSDYDTGDDNYQRSVANKANAYSNFIKLAEVWKKSK